MPRSFSDFEENIVRRAEALEGQVRSSFDAATAGKPVGANTRRASDTDYLYAERDATLLARMAALGPYLTDAEKRRENLRSARAGGYMVYPEVGTK